MKTNKISYDSNRLKTLLALFVFAAALIFAVIPAFGELEMKNGIDALLIIDTSGSMNDSDRQRNAIEATKMFIDMLEPNNSRVGILGFNDTLTGVVEITEITNQDDKDRLKAEVDQMQYQGYTDIGMPLKEAVGIMSRNMRATNSPMVLLLTDGNIAINPNLTDRSDEDSYNDIVEAIATAGKELPVYTIGLNYDGSVDRQLLRTIADNTGGRSYIIAQAAELPQIFNEIFADHVKSSLVEVTSFIADGSSYADVNIDIADSFVAVANIIILSDNELEDVKMLDPSGAEVEFNQSTVTFSSSRKYSIVKLVFPQRGDWTLRAKGVSGDMVKVNLIYQYNVGVDIEVVQNEAIGSLFMSTNPISINGFIVVNGERAASDELYRSTASNAMITGPDGNLIAKIPMTATADGLTAEYQPESDVPLNVYIETVASTFIKESANISLQFEPAPTSEPIPPVLDELPETEPTPEQVPEPEPKPPLSDRDLILRYVAIGAALIVATVIAMLVMVKRGKPKFFSGYIEVRAMTEDGNYTSVEVPPLHTYVGSVDLEAFLLDNMPVKVKKDISSLPFSTHGATLKPGVLGGRPAVIIENKSNSIFMDEDCVAFNTKKIIWEPDEKIIIGNNDEDSVARIEITYRLEEM